MDKTLKIHRIENKNPSQKVKETFQIIIIGNTKVGKTSIIQKSLYDNFSEVYQKSKSYNSGTWPELFVNNLSYKTTDESLKKYFSKYNMFL